MNHEETRLAVLAAWERWSSRLDHEDPELAVRAFFLSFRAAWPGIVENGNFQTRQPLLAVRFWCLEREHARMHNGGRVANKQRTA